MRRPLSIFAAAAAMFVAMAFAGCATIGDEPGDETGQTPSEGECVPPLVGHWMQSDQDAHDHFATPTAGETTGDYAYVSRGTTQTGRYEIVHQSPETGCPYTIVAFLLFLKDAPGVVTWNFTSSTTATVENERAWDDRPGNFTVTFVDSKQKP